MLMDILYILGAIKVFAKLTNGKCLSKKCMEGKTAVIVGKPTDHGLETALDLGSRGCRVIMGTEAGPVPERIARQPCVNVVLKDLDLTSMDSTRKFAKSINETEKRLDILIINSGLGGFRKIYTEDGLLKVMQVNHFAPFLLTHLLLDLMTKTENSRLVFVSSLYAFTSRLHSATAINEPPNVSNQILQNYLEYSNSKLCMTAVALEFALRLRSRGITCNAVYPGLVDRTAIPGKTRGARLTLAKKLIQVFLYLYGKTPRESAQTILHCALAKELDGVNGKFFVDCREFVKPQLATVQEFREKVWEESEVHVKLAPHERIPKLDGQKKL